MHSFTYKHKGILYESTAAHYLDGCYDRYRVSLYDGLEFVIAPMGIGGPNGKIIWLQSNKEGEVIQPHNLVQAIGEGLNQCNKSNFLIFF
jgi:hypothetical protein